MGGEHARELITSEIIFWLGKLLAGIDDELMDWAAIQTATASAWKRGWAKGTLREWADDLLKHVLFKARPPLSLCSGLKTRFPHFCALCSVICCCAPGTVGFLNAMDVVLLQIIPIENIQGRKAVEGGDKCLRKTTAGVDLNRNWEFAWTAVITARPQQSSLLIRACAMALRNLSKYGSMLFVGVTAGAGHVCSGAPACCSCMGSRLAGHKHALQSTAAYQACPCHALGQAEEGSEEYGGPRPFSEPETRIVRLIGQATRPQAFVNLHSGEYAVYVPWDSQASLAPGLPADVGDVLEKLDSYCQCMHGAAGEVAG